QAFCSSGLAGNPNGAACTSNAQCSSTSLCLRAAADQQLHCTDVSQALFEGAPCMSGGDCASGNCWGRRARAVSNNNSVARCSAVCRQSVMGRSDCVAGMTCVPILLQDNGTPGDASDDTVMGFCLTQTPDTTAEQCTSDTQCTGSIGHGDKCDL